MQVQEVKDGEVEESAFTTLLESFGQLAALQLVEFHGNTLTALPESFNQRTALPGSDKLQIKRF